MGLKPGLIRSKKEPGNDITGGSEAVDDGWTMCRPNNPANSYCLVSGAFDTPLEDGFWMVREEEGHPTIGVTYQKRV